jgi:hypothetical protein
MVNSSSQKNVQFDQGFKMGGVGSYLNAAQSRLESRLTHGGGRSTWETLTSDPEGPRKGDAPV